MKLILRFTFLLLLGSLASCLSGDYEDVTLDSALEMDSVALSVPVLGKILQENDKANTLHVKLDGHFSYGDQLIAYGTEDCMDNPVGTVSVIHSTHAMIKIPTKFGKSQRVFFKNYRGSLSSKCKGVKIH